MRSTRLLSMLRTRSTAAAKSIWPDSGWPPISAPSLAARSTLTRAPTAYPPSVVMSRLCSMTSKVAVSADTMRVTVRQTPSTDTLAPMARSTQKPAGKSMVKVRRPCRSAMPAMVAVPWTMPVNIQLLMRARRRGAWTNDESNRLRRRRPARPGRL
ncbi:Uncharacterised protein [Bordetella pertussis]|nr:Uncharacterised protein [Bordetella pertussis]